LLSEGVPFFQQPAAGATEGGGMPDPIQSSVGLNQSYYDPSEQVSRAPEASVAPPAASSAPAAASSAPASGTQLLLDKFGSGQKDCTKHLVNSSLSFLTAGGATLVAAGLAATGVGAVVAAVGAAGAAGKGLSDLNSYGSCEDENKAMAAYAADCNAKGGVLVAGAGDSDAVCLNTAPMDGN
jgi:hypothetical protein